MENLNYRMAPSLKVNGSGTLKGYLRVKVLSLYLMESLLRAIGKKEKERVKALFTIKMAQYG